MPPLPVILPIALVGLIWATVAIRKTGLIGGCIATIVAGTCLGHPFFHVSVITLDRALFGLVVLLYFMNRSFFELPARPLRRLDLVMILFMICLMGSTFTTDWKYAENVPVSTLLFFYLLPFAFYWVTSRCQLGERSHKWMLITFMLFGIYLSLTAFCEVKGISAAVFPKYIMSAEHIEFLGRGRGPLLNPIGNGILLSAALLCTLMLWPYAHRMHRPGLLLIAAVIGIGALLTLTRSVWVGVAGSMVGMATLIVPKHHRYRVVLVALVSGGLLLGLTGGKMSAFKRDKHVSVEDMAQSAKLRPILAAFAYEMFWDNPVTGVGLGQYKRHNLAYLTERSFDLPMEKAKTYVQHNIFLSLLTETGLIGLCVFVALLLAMFVNGWWLWYSVDHSLWQRQCGLLMVLMVAAYLPNGMFHEMSLIPMVNMVMFFFAGLVRNLIDAAEYATSSAPAVTEQCALPFSPVRRNKLAITCRSLDRAD